MVAVGSHFPGSCPAAACSCYIDDGESDGNEVNITTRARAANGDLAVAAASALEATRALTTERCPFLLARCKGVRQTLLNKKVRERRAERGEGGELSALGTWLPGHVTCSWRSHPTRKPTAHEQQADGLGCLPRAVVGGRRKRKQLCCPLLWR